MNKPNLIVGLPKGTNVKIYDSLNRRLDGMIEEVNVIVLKQYLQDGLYLKLVGVKDPDKEIKGYSETVKNELERLEKLHK